MIEDKFFRSSEWSKVDCHGRIEMQKKELAVQAADATLFGLEFRDLMMESTPLNLHIFPRYHSLQTNHFSVSTVSRHRRSG